MLALKERPRRSTAQVGCRAGGEAWGGGGQAGGRRMVLRGGVADPSQQLGLCYSGPDFVWLAFMPHLPASQPSGCPTPLPPHHTTPQMARDPLTLVIALDRKGAAAGELYVDDGRSFAFQVLAGGWFLGRGGGMEGCVPWLHAAGCAAWGGRAAGWLAGVDAATSTAKAPLRAPQYAAVIHPFIHPFIHPHSAAAATWCRKYVASVFNGAQTLNPVLSEPLNPPSHYVLTRCSVAPTPTAPSQ